MDQASSSEQAVTLRQITVNPVTVADLRAALAAGISDFRKAPLMGLFFGGIYALGGIVVVYALASLNAPYWVIPAAVGFPLLGPFIAVGLYEISRRLETGTPLSWKGVLFEIVESRKREVSWMAFVVLFIFWIWMYQVRLWLALFLGFEAFASVGDFLTTITTTSDGLGFLAVGTVVGAALATVLFSVTVVSIPLLLDRDPDIVTAMITSVQTVLKNPVVMLGWGAFVAVLLVAAMLPLFLGLVVVLPVLGHATWHLYRRAVTVSS
ncbi:DUF2189 domain-containing protein [Amorphus orientalis]|uniref:Membrane protein n=1 Tax=Amorphus orientalis TaxID=649198 RepID=A0AAE3VLG1_9HYPH|nr:DUF2189 domain-containing protein [Amorphus orientalis]MDQ0314694.1 putative membrane protein [Amorphus orientalis]